jgi:hypothetical protein
VLGYYSPEVSLFLDDLSESLAVTLKSSYEENLANKARQTTQIKYSNWLRSYNCR